MSCSIHKETIGYIEVPEELWDAFCEEVSRIDSTCNIWDSDLRIEDLVSIEELVPKYISTEDYADLIEYCDAAEVSCGS